jgi:hypothetical protein
MVAVYSPNLGDGEAGKYDDAGCVERDGVWRDVATRCLVREREEQEGGLADDGAQGDGESSGAVEGAPDDGGAEQELEHASVLEQGEGHGVGVGHAVAGVEGRHIDEGECGNCGDHAEDHENGAESGFPSRSGTHRRLRSTRYCDHRIQRNLRFS